MISKCSTQEIIEEKHVYKSDLFYVNKVNSYKDL